MNEVARGPSCDGFFPSAECPGRLVVHTPFSALTDVVESTLDLLHSLNSCTGTSFLRGAGAAYAGPTGSSRRLGRPRFLCTCRVWFSVSTPTSLGNVLWVGDTVTVGSGAPEGSGHIPAFPRCPSRVWLMGHLSHGAERGQPWAGGGPGPVCGLPLGAWGAPPPGTAPGLFPVPGHLAAADSGGAR